MKIISEHRHAILAGSMAALAAVVLKFALSVPGPLPGLVAKVVPGSQDVLESATMLLRGLLFGAGIFLNSMMMHFFIESMRRTSSLVATVVNGVVNFSISSLLGWSLFGEQITLYWFIGILLTMSGVYLISNSPESRTATKEKTS